MNPQVLILALWHDAHAAAIRWALQQNNIDTLLASSMRLRDDAKLSIWANAEQFHLESSLFSSSLQRIHSVWYRRPLQPEAGICHEADRAFIAGQWRYFQKNIFSAANDLLDALWINRPEMAVRAENKLVQLQAARRVGLEFPDTVVSNDAQDVKTMLQRWPRVIFKTFYPHNWKSASSGNIYNMSVKLLDQDSPLPEDAIAMCPGIYQRYIEKICDVRVTVIGDRYFAVRMQRNTGTAYVDWRGHELDKDMQMEVITLPATIEHKLRALMKQLDIVFGCIDLVIDRDGQIYFIEINQAGQFLFLEETLPALPLLKAMTAMLGSGRSDYSLGSGVDISFADYLLTDDHQQVAQAQAQLTLSALHQVIET